MSDFNTYKSITSLLRPDAPENFSFKEASKAKPIKDLVACPAAKKNSIVILEVQKSSAGTPTNDREHLPINNDQQLQ